MFIIITINSTCLKRLKTFKSISCNEQAESSKTLMTSGGNSPDEIPKTIFWIAAKVVKSVEEVSPASTRCNRSTRELSSLKSKVSIQEINSEFLGEPWNEFQ